MMMMVVMYFWKKLNKSTRRKRNLFKHNVLVMEVCMVRINLEK